MSAETTRRPLLWYVIYVDAVEGRRKIEQFDTQGQAEGRAAVLRTSAFARDVRVISAR